MKHFRLYLGWAMVLVTVLYFIFWGPSLISADDWLLVGLGFAILVVILVFWVVFVTNMFKMESAK
jgi:hypothetical protein